MMFIIIIYVISLLTFLSKGGAGLVIEIPASFDSCSLIRLLYYRPRSTDHRGQHRGWLVEDSLVIGYD
jgi:hypothetical protein